MKAVAKSFLLSRFVGALGVVAVAHLVDVGGSSRISLWADLFNAGHVLLMGAFSLVMLGLSVDVLGERVPDRLGHYLVAFSAAVLVGGLSEVLQIPGPRDADAWDVARDSVGAFCFLSFFGIRDRLLNAGRARWVRWWRFAIAAVAACVLAVSWLSAIRWGVAFYHRNTSFPKLTAFDSKIQSLFWSTRNATLRSTAPPPNWPRSGSGRVGKLICDPSTRSGFAINKVYPNWSGYESLALSVYLESDIPTTFVVQIQDGHFRGVSGDRFTTVRHIIPGGNVVTVQLRDAAHLSTARPLDLEHVATAYFLTRDTTRTTILYVDDIRLK